MIPAVVLECCNKAVQRLAITEKEKIPWIFCGCWSLGAPLPFFFFFSTENVDPDLS